MLDALTSAYQNPGVLIQATFLTGNVYLWSGVGTVSWNGKTWTGVGDLLGLSPISEGSTIEAKGIAISLSGINSTLLNDIINEFQISAPVTVYYALFNEGVIIDNPLVAFSGEMDRPEIDVDGDKSVISVNCEDRLVELNTPVNRRYTADDQQRSYPGDLVFSFVNLIQQQNLYIGGAPVREGNL